MKKIAFFLIFFNFIFLKSSIGIDLTQVSKIFSEIEYAHLVINDIKQMLNEEEFHYSEINLRSSSKIDINFIIIPNFIIIKDSKNNLNLFLDTLNPIGKVIVFKKNKIIGTMIYLNGVFYCAKKIKGISQFKCREEIWEEKFYYKSLHLSLKENPQLLFSIVGIDRCWFLIDERNRGKTITYDLEVFDIDFFLKKNNFYQYKKKDSIKFKDIH